MKFIAVIVFFALVFSSLVFSAIISGSVYSAETFEPLKNAVVSVNSKPEQRIIAKDANYLFNLPAGTYTISAKSFENSELKLEGFETITVNTEGSFKLDLVLFPAEQDVNLFEELNQKLPENNINPEELKTTSFNIIWFLMLAVLIALLAVMVFLMLKKKPIENFKEKDLKIEKEKPKILDKNAQIVLQVLREKGNRATQKEVLEKVHFGEAYLSLVLSELEHEGKIKKFKKGRGNIIVLKE